MAISYQIRPAEDRLKAADSLGCRLVMKGLVAGGIHKTEMGLV